MADSPCCGGNERSDYIKKLAEMPGFEEKHYNIQEVLIESLGDAL
jgi:hypothetical protein